MDRAKIIEIAKGLPEGEYLWMMEFSIEREEWSATSRRWNANAENLETSLDYLHDDRDSEKGDWEAVGRAVGPTPEEAVANLVRSRTDA